MNLSYPLQILKNGDRWVIVEGYHRLARHWLEGSVRYRVRLHSDECWDAVVVDDALQTRAYERRETRGGLVALLP